jgi:hypothetical protein
MDLSIGFVKYLRVPVFKVNAVRKLVAKIAEEAFNEKALKDRGPWAKGASWVTPLFTADGAQAYFVVGWRLETSPVNEVTAVLGGRSYTRGDSGPGRRSTARSVMSRLLNMRPANKSWSETSRCCWTPTEILK